jgi:hypothetical protein
VTKRNPLPPFASSLQRGREIFLYVAGTDADKAWCLAKWRALNKLPVMLIPSGGSPFSYRWPSLHGACVLVIFAPGADVSIAPRLTLTLFDAGAGEVHAVDIDGKTAHAIYRREDRRAAA